MRQSGKIFLLIQLMIQMAGLQALSAQQMVSLRNDGAIPIWLTNGPFEVQTTGFGDLSDKQAIDENNLNPEYLSEENNPSVKQGSTSWQFLSADKNGYTDMKNYYGWKTFSTSEKIWYEKIVYAYSEVYSADEKTVDLKFGGNTVIQILLNGVTVYKSLNTVNARKDNFTQAVSLKKGMNKLLVKLANSHHNHSLSFFDPLGYEWGFYLRLTGQSNEDLKDISIRLNAQNVKPDFKIIPTCFYKKSDRILQQKYLIEITSDVMEYTNGEISLKVNNKDVNIPLKEIKFGLNTAEFYINEPVKPEKVTASLKLAKDDNSSEKSFTLRALPKYELYFMPSTHMDIGYTNPQPVVIERQLNTLDQVIAKCSADKKFKWTIETMWLLENFRKSRSSEAFDKLISLIKNGRISVSPIYSNPFTGWVSENEMIESFRWAELYKEKYGIEYFGAVYNDVPGQSWALPQVLKKAGVKVLVDGINEIFSNYKYQSSLPKVFKWLGSSSSDTLLLYLTDAYTEGAIYGLERDTDAIENRIWHRIKNLNEHGYPLSKILISGVLSDNSGIAFNQYENALKWNEKYEYPKFIISTLNDFCKELAEEKYSPLKTIRGDWTSDWDILYQGETKRMLKYRWVQNNLPSAEILSTISGLNDPNSNSFASKISSIYKDLLEFSGHGSGLEYGYGSRFENRLTDDYRKGYVEDAYLNTRELLERTAYRLTAPKESFDSHGLVVFNTLSWNRSIPVEIEFPETDLNNYSIVDLSDNSKVSSFRKNDKLYFLASDIPGIGSKQYELINTSTQVQNSTEKTDFIENESFKIKLSEKGISITDKSSGKDILKTDDGKASFMPLRKRFQLNENFSSVSDKLKLTGTEKNNVFEDLNASYDNDIFRQIKFRLWKKLNRIDITLMVSLNGMKDTQHTEEYGIAFNFNQRKSKVLFESLGGLMGMSDRFSAAGHQYFSIRRVIDISGEDGHFVIASPDCRIFMLDTISGGNILVANVMNNFPSSWNRNEDKDGTVEFSFSIAKVNEKNYDATAFGYEVSSEPVVRRSWYKKNEPVKQFLRSSNPIVKIISLRSLDEESGSYQMILQNSSYDKDQSVQIASDYLLNNVTVSEVDLTGKIISDIAVKNNAITVKMFPNSIKKIMVKFHHH